MKKTHSSERITYLDTACGILIVYMIIYHCAQWSGTWDIIRKYCNLFSFFMPWFFFKGGMFHKLQDTKRIASSGYKRLIIPFILFSIIGTLILWSKYAVEGSLSIRKVIGSVGSVVKYGAFYGNLPLWFLTSLFAVRIIFNSIFSKVYNSESSSLRKCWWLVLIIICTFFIPLHYISVAYAFEYPWYLSNISSGMAFYTCGFLLKNIKITYRISLLICIIWFLISMVEPIWVVMASGRSYSMLYPLWILYCLIGILSINSVLKNFYNHRCVCSQIGMDSMSYYCIHWCVILLVSIFFKESNNPNWSFFLSLVIANIIFLPLLTKIISNTKYKNVLQ